MQIAELFIGDSPIAGLESFDHHGDDEDELLQAPVDNDSGEGSYGKATPITDSQPSEARPVMSES